jgi:sodium transport system ATP-binding protein
VPPDAFQHDGSGEHIDADNRTDECQDRVGSVERSPTDICAKGCGGEARNHAESQATRHQAESQQGSHHQDQVSPAAVSVDRLEKSLGKNKVLGGISLEANAGEIFGLLGPNGAGKTTTLRVICTLLAPDAGSVKVLGFDTRSTPEEVRRRVGVVTADIGVYPRLSARENITYFAQLSGVPDRDLKHRVDAVIDRLGIASFANQRADSLSSGQKQKVAIGRAIVHDPEVLMFDEPTSNLDVLASREVREFMVEARGRGRCVIFSTHVLHDAERLCDRVTILHEGNVVATGSTSEVRGSHRDLEDAFLELVL